MSFLIFSDIHGNLPAFEKMLKAESGISKYICLGDVVNYGPWSNECVDLLGTLPAVKLIGNHEEDLLAGSYGGKSELVKTFFNICIQNFARRPQIAKYEKEFKAGDYTCMHTINQAYVYPDTEIDITGNYFIGHSHHQFNRITKDYHVINVGSVGQNRKEINVINYALFDPDSNKVVLKELIYDVGEVIQKMTTLKYPQACIDYYRNKSQRSK